jgi:LasA protease
MKIALNTAVLFFLIVLTACNSLWGTEVPPTNTPDIFWTVNPNTPLPFATFTPVIITATSAPTETSSPVTETPPVSPTSSIPKILYYSQAGDSLPSVAGHFGVLTSEIGAPAGSPLTGLLVPNTPLYIPNRLQDVRTTPSARILPDSELVYSPSAIEFNTQAYVSGANGKLNTYEQYLSTTGWTSGADAVQRIATENSVNPRLLLALIEYESGWVLGQPTNYAQEDYPLGHLDFQYRLLYRQMMWAVQELSIGYYGWRSGALTEITLTDGTILRLAPDLNAGSVAIQYFFAKRYGYEDWMLAVDPANGFPALYARMFGDAWTRAQAVEPLFPPNLVQPPLILPFEVNYLWSFTGGPHSAWGFTGVQDSSWDVKGALAALDFAPSADATGCLVSDAWVLASAPGRVIRSGNGVVMLDLDGDNNEQTGWDLLFMHIATRDRVAEGAWLNVGDRVGHPSCEGGTSTGTHLHIARKYNGEWVLADGPIPFTLSGWVAHAGNQTYQGTLTKGDLTIVSNQNGTFESRIVRKPGE